MAASVLLVAASAGAQDHVNVTIVAPAVGSFPRLAAGSFDITNQDQLVSVKTTTAQGQSQTQSMAGTTAPVRVQMGLPWGGEVAQLIKAMVSGANPAIDHITCDFVHAGSDQPYYTVVIDHPIIARVDLAYDSAAVTATEQISLAAPQVDFLDGGSSANTPAAPATGGSRAIVLRRAAARPQPPLRLTATPQMLRRLMSSTTAAAGPPIIGFASFAASAGSTLHFAPEASFPTWASGAMIGVETLAITFERQVLMTSVTAADGSRTTVPHPGPLQPTQASFTKSVGSLSNDLQAAVSGRQHITTTFELADAPGRLGYSFIFTSGLISSDHTSLSNGHAAEQVALTSGSGVIVKDVRRNITAQVP